MAHRYKVVGVHQVNRAEALPNWRLATDEEARLVGAEVNDMWILVGRRAYLLHSFVDTETRLKSRDFSTDEGLDAAEFEALTLSELIGSNYMAYVMVPKVTKHT